MMIYIILYLHRHPLKGIQTLAHPFTASDEVEADKICVSVATELKCPAWIVAVDKPDIKPQLSLVKDDHAPRIEGDALIITQPR